MLKINEDVVEQYDNVRRAIFDEAHGRSTRDSIARTVTQLEQYLERPLRVVVLGETNSGKTSLVNSIVGCGMLPTAVVDNTPVSVTVRHGQRVGIRALSESQGWVDIGLDNPHEDMSALGRGSLRAVEICAPMALLERFEMVDTPGRGNPNQDVLGADVAVWCTHAAQAWSESERRVWEGLPRRCRRNGILAITHADVLDSPGDRAKVMQRLHAEAGEYFEDFVFVENSSDGEGCDGVLERLDSICTDYRAHRQRAVRRIASRLDVKARVLGEQRQVEREHAFVA